VTVLENRAPPSDGDIFLAPQNGPAQDGPMILDPRGNLLWFDPYPVSQNTLITDFRVQRLWGEPVLTWWQGDTNAGHGRGQGLIFNQEYRQIATVKAANALDMGLHAFLLADQGDAYINAPSPVRLPAVSKPTVDSVIQEIDIKTGSFCSSGTRWITYRCATPTSRRRVPAVSSTPITSIRSRSITTET
jgi:Arylsulfotransferase (ASST)